LHVPTPPDTVSVELAPEHIADGLADADDGGPRHGVNVIASNAPALLTVVTAVSRNMVMDDAVAVTLKLNDVNELLVVLALAELGLVVPPAGSTRTETVALVELVL
jgi:hypothetical protein